MEGERRRILISEFMDESGLTALREQPETVVEYDPHLHRDPAALKLAAEKAHALIVRNQTRVSEDLVSPRLRVVGRLGVGLDNLDLEALRRHGVVVTAARGANAVSVAEYVLAYLFTVRRPLARYHASVATGRWDRQGATGHEVYGTTLGLLGMGDIAKRLAVRARALGMRVLGSDPYVSPYDFGWMEIGVEAVDLERLLESSDFLSVHIPKDAYTTGLIGAKELARMKPSAHLIQTARGGIVDEAALADALRSNRLGGAALDVREHEPPQDDRFDGIENVLLTPHIAGLTEEAGLRTSRMVAEDVLAVLAGRHARGAVATT